MSTEAFITVEDKYLFDTKEIDICNFTNIVSGTV